MQVCFFISLLFTYCFVPTVPPMQSEQFLLQKTIKYSYGANGPVYYDCGGILTEALRKDGYKGKKIHSKTYDCVRKDRTQAKKGDVLVNRNEGERHVALITKGYNDGFVVILDYVEKKTRATYRKYPLYQNIYILNGDCLLNL